MSFYGKLNFFVKLCIFYYAINFSRNNYTGLKAKFKSMNKDMMKSLKGFESTHNAKLVMLWLGVFVKGWFHYQGKNNHSFGSFEVKSCLLMGVQLMNYLKHCITFVKLPKSICMKKLFLMCICDK